MQHKEETKSRHIYWFDSKIPSYSSPETLSAAQLALVCMWVSMSKASPNILANVTKVCPKKYDGMFTMAFGHLSYNPMQKRQYWIYIGCAERINRVFYLIKTKKKLKNKYHNDVTYSHESWSNHRRLNYRKRCFLKKMNSWQFNCITQSKQ
jgi:hypothetical protein